MIPPGRQVALALTRQFYRWELRGRGALTWPEPVGLEPPFVEFPGHLVPPSLTVDDGRVETFGSTLARGLGRLFGTQPEPVRTPEPEPAEPAPPPAEPVAEWAELQFALPPSAQPDPDSFGLFLACVSGLPGPLAFEVVGTSAETVFQLAVPASVAEAVAQQFRAFFPEAVVTRRDGFLRERFLGAGAGQLQVAELGLHHEFMVPLRALDSLAADPWVALCGALDRLPPERFGLIQVLLTPTRAPWAPSVLRAVTLSDGRPFFANDPELVTRARAKLAAPLYAVVLRVVAVGPDEPATTALLEALTGGFRTLAEPDGNGLVPLEPEPVTVDEQLGDLFLRRTRRSGMLLNVDELVTLAHPPSAEVRSSLLRRVVRKTRAVPAAFTSAEQAVFLGDNEHEGESRAVWLPDRLRLQHCHVLGATGSGKSTLLGLMAWQDLTFGNGVAVIDPHGDLIDRLIPHIPPERWDDVVLFDPADEEFAVAFNPLAPGSGRERDLRATDFIAVMKRHTSGWGDQMSSLLGNAVLAFLHSERGGTLPELRRFLVDPAFRTNFLKSVTHGEVLHYWEHEAALANRSAVGSIVTRLDELLRYESLLHLLGQRANRLDFADILDSGKIFLARLSKGQIGATNAFLLGSLLVARFHQTAIARQARNPAERPPYFLILDEAAELLTGTVAEILTGARKYGLGLTLAHQHLGQLRPEDGVRGAVLGSCATRVCFRVDGEDARKLADEFAGFGPTDLMNLPDRQAIARLGPRDTACNLETIFVPTPPRTYAEVYPEILARTRARYCTPRAEIRAQLAELRSQIPPRRDKVDPFAKLAREQEEETPVVPTASEAVVAAAGAPEPPVALPAVAAATALAPEALPHFALAAEREHRVTQNFLRQLAGGRGWQSRLEAVLGAAGQLDVLLERGGRRLGCEVAVTNQTRFEVAGLARRLAAGLDFVLVVADDRGHRDALARRAEQELAAPEFARVRFLGRDDVAAFLDELDQQDSRREEVVRDARVVHEQVALEPDVRAESAAAVTALIRRLGRRGGAR